MLFEQDVLRRVILTKPGALRFDTEPSGPCAESPRSLTMAVLVTSCAGNSTPSAERSAGAPGRPGVPRGSGHREPHRLAHPVTDQQRGSVEPATAQNAGSRT